MRVWLPPLAIGVMLYLEIQEGKERMARLKYVDEYQAISSACTVRMLAALSIGEKSLASDKNNCNVSFLAIPGLHQ